MNNAPLKYLFFVTKPYSFSILEPIQETIENQNSGTVKWFMASSAKHFSCPGEQLRSNEEVIDYSPDAVLVPGNVAPHFWPGLKVQIFHGLDEEVKGFYTITGFFDLYCTSGPAMTERFSTIAKKKKHFLVRETGWPKLDPVYKGNYDNRAQKDQMIKKCDFDPDLPVILYAPTFPPKYTSAFDLLDEVKTLRDKYNWIIKFHPLMDKNIVEKYKLLESVRLQVIDELNILPVMAASDVMVTDTSSVAYEYLSFNRPLITYNALARKEKGINIQKPKELYDAIEKSLQYPMEHVEKRKKYLNEIHPYTDGVSSNRILDAINDILKNDLLDGLKKKPKNIVRKYQIKKMIARSQS